MMYAHQGLDVPPKAVDAASAAPTPVSTSAPTPTLAPALVPSSPVSTEELHKERLRAYYSLHRPENVGMVDALYGKLGKQIWHSLEAKYPGTTAHFTEVCVCLCVRVGCTRECLVTMPVGA